jgi:hypothetical protein
MTVFTHVFTFQIGFLCLVDYYDLSCKDQLYKLFLRFNLLGFVLSSLEIFLPLPIIVFLAYWVHIYIFVREQYSKFFITVSGLVILHLSHPLKILTFTEYLIASFILFVESKENSEKILQGSTGPITGGKKSPAAWLNILLVLLWIEHLVVL